MIIELLCTPVFALVELIIGMLPAYVSLPAWGIETINLISKGMLFFPPDVWAVVIGNVLFWLSAHFAWSIIEWIYKKIPGVD